MDQAVYNPLMCLTLAERGTLDKPCGDQKARHHDNACASIYTSESSWRSWFSACLHQ
jgi:hypothetical protein